MGKRKRQRRNRSGQGDHDKSHPTPVTTGKKIPSSFIRSGRSRRLSIVLAAAGVLLLAGIGAQQFLFSTRVSVDLLPDPDLSAMEPQVAEKIRAVRMDVKRNPHSATAWGKLGMNFAVHDLKQEAVPCYKQAVALDPDEFRWSYYCAIVLREIGSPEALQWFERSRDLNPNYVSLNVQFGQALLDDGLLEESSESFRNAIAANPKSSHAYLGLAQIALSQGDLQASQDHLERALEINPRHGEIHGLLAEVYRRLKEPKKADHEMLMARPLLKETPLDDALYLDLVDEGVSAFWYQSRGRAYVNKGLYAEAAREFRMALQAKPDPQSHTNLGVALHHLGKSEEAVEQHRAALALRPAYREALNNLGATLFELGKIEEAIAYGEKAKQLDPAHPTAYLNVGTFLMSFGRTAEAIDAFRQGLANAPYEPRIAMRLAWLLATTADATLRDGPEAVRLAEAVCELTSYRMPEPLDVLAAGYAEIRHFNRAIELARQAHQLALSARRTNLANQIEYRLKLYEAKLPFREKKL